jgi:hypothetical protein
MDAIGLFVPEIDSIIKFAQSKGSFISNDSYLRLNEIYKIFSCIKPGEDDEKRHIWIEVLRGPISAFGDYEEFRESGEVETFEEFEQLWKDYYHEETKWYRLDTAKYQDELFFYLDGKLICSTRRDDPPAKVPTFDSDYFDRFTDWLLRKVVSETDKLKKDEAAYNQFIEQNLPWSKRFGKIKRRDYWDVLGDETVRLDKNLGDETIEKLKIVVEKTKSQNIPSLEKMTAREFFRICEICYNANSYFRNSQIQLTPKEKYLKMADGRDGGLRELEEDSQSAFQEWYHSSVWLGGHPWEICRGGNSTHISLYISDMQGKWKVRLAGSSIVRVEETVKMAVALYDNGVPFELSDAENILRMVTGNDYIGIVPEYIFPRYCHGLFPKEDQIIDFMNLGYDKDKTSKIVEKTYWYPLEWIALA